MSDDTLLEFKSGYDFKLFSRGEEMYLIRELSGTERDQFLSAMKKKVDTSNPNKPIVKDHTGLNSLLVGYAAEKIESVAGLDELPKTLEDLRKFIEEEGKCYSDFVVQKIEQNQVQAWGTGMVSRLSAVASELSGLNKKDPGDSEKKD